VQESSERDNVIKEKQTQSEAPRSSLADRDASFAHLENELAKFAACMCNLEADFDIALREQELLIEAEIFVMVFYNIFCR
jgi:hypothetical protein